MFCGKRCERRSDAPAGFPERAGFLRDRRARRAAGLLSPSPRWRHAAAGRACGCATGRTVRDSRWRSCVA